VLGSLHPPDSGYFVICKTSRRASQKIFPREPSIEYYETLVVVDNVTCELFPTAGILRCL